MTPEGHGVIRGRRDLLYDPKGHSDLCGCVCPSVLPQKVTGSLEVAMTDFITPKVTVTFVVDVNLFMTPKGLGFIWGRSDHVITPTPKVPVTFVVGLT